MRFILRADQSCVLPQLPGGWTGTLWDHACLYFRRRHWPDDINPAYQELVRKNLAFHGKTEEEFAAGVERVIKAEQELFG